MKEMFTKKQSEQIISKKLDIDYVNKHIENFKNGFPFLRLIKAATIGEGILSIDDRKVKSYISKYEKESKNYEIVKFIPASGAATRMFKDFYLFLSKVENGKEELEVDIEFIKSFVIYSSHIFSWEGNRRVG